MPTRVDALTNAQDRAVSAIRERVLEFATALWNTSPSLRDKDVARITRRLIPVVQAGQIQVAQLTNAYIAGIANAEGIPLKTPTVDRDEILHYRGVPAQTVYERPATTTYVSLSEGETFDVAKAAGLARLASIVTTDLQQARTRQARRTYTGSGFEYTVRILTGSENCALCVIASTQRYHKSQLMPIHPGCDCGQKGVKSAADPGQVINPELLEATHAQVEAKFGDTDRGARVITGDNPVSDYLDLIVTHEHGELGPTLAWRGDHFTGPADLH